MAYVVSQPAPQERPVFRRPRRQSRLWAWLAGRGTLARLSLPGGGVLEFGSGVFVVHALILLVFLRVGAIEQGLKISFALFLAISAHELGHAAAGRIAGGRLRSLRLGGVSGLCRMAGIERRRGMILFTLGGPLANLALCAAFWAALTLLPVPGFEGKSPPASDLPPLHGALRLMMILNAILFAANLVPVMPQDGGMLCYLVADRLLPERAATRATGAIGLLAFAAALGGIVVVWLTWSLILPYFAPVRPSWHMLRTGLPPTPPQPGGRP